MIFEVFNNPLMIDFLYVAARLPRDEVEQLEAFTGHPFTIDGAAVGAFVAQGPKWVAKVDTLPIAVGGLVPERPGVWRDFMLNVEGNAFNGQNFWRLTALCRRICRHMFKTGQAHRIECIVPESRLLARPEIARWYKAVGYSREARMPGYLANGHPAVMYSRVVPYGNG